MRVLIAATEAPLPPLGGLRHPLRELILRIRQRHEVSLVGHLWPEQDEAPIDGVRAVYMRVPVRGRGARLGSFVRASLIGRPLRAVELERAMMQAVTGALSQTTYDVIHISGLPSATLAPYVRDIPSLMAVLDASHLNAKADVTVSRPAVKPLRWAEYRNTMRFERSQLRRFDRVVTVSDADADALRRLDPAVAVAVVPNGVDADLFSVTTRTPEPHLCVFIGTMSWAPNIGSARHMAREVLPRVRATFPDARFAVVGRGLAPSLATELEGYDGVTAVGEVSDVRPWLERAHVAVCPMLGGTGIKNKLLESMAAGVPSVATSLACQGIEVADGRHILIRDGADAFAAGIVRIFRDVDLAANLSHSARTFVRQMHSWDGVALSYERLYEAIRQERRRGAVPPCA